MRITVTVFFIFLFSSCVYNEITPEVTFCEPDHMVFSQTVKPILDNYCSSCHIEGSARVLLSSYDEVMNAEQVHSMLERIESLEMPPYGSLPMNQNEILIIKKWINCE